MNRTARILAIVLALVLVGGGIYAAYQTGFDNGAAVAALSGDNSGTGTIVVHDTWRGGYGWHGGFGFFPFFPILFFLLIFGVFRPWRGGPNRGWTSREGNFGGGWGPPREAMEQRMKEWHQQAHNEGDADRPGS
jgi:hypothetical protein